MLGWLPQQWGRGRVEARPASVWAKNRCPWWDPTTSRQDTHLLPLSEEVEAIVFGNKEKQTLDLSGGISIITYHFNVHLL